MWARYPLALKGNAYPITTSDIFTLLLVAVSGWVFVVLIFLDVFWFYPP